MDATTRPSISRNTEDILHKIAGLLLLGVLVAMKAVAAYRYRFNTDETQHLHVIWGWTRGMIQYRDLFDNHPPLFHMLMAPLFRLFPERADIVVPMRLMMIPFYLASLAAVYRIGCALYSARVAVWLALIAGALPGYFFPGTEFRPDDLYAAIWLWALVAAVERPFTTARAGVVGLLLGACASITMKTSLLVVSLTIATVFALGLRWRVSPRQILGRMAAFCLGGAVVPVLVVLYFAAHHALPELYYCVLKHNVVPRAERWGGSSFHYFYLPIGLVFLIAGALWIYRSSPDAGVAARRVLIAVLPGVYFLLLYSYWPDIIDADQLPAMPLVPLAILALVPWVPEKVRVSAVGNVVLPTVFVVCVGLIWHTRVLQRGSVTKYVDRIATVLKLTEANDYVMDLKGDAIYRQRPIYYAIETFTKVRMAHGWIKNDIVERLIATRTAVCFHPPYPGADVIKFVNANYLPLTSSSDVRVLGQLLPAGSGGVIRFTVTVPGEYVLLRGGRAAQGVLDGRPYAASLVLNAGAHEFTPADSTAMVTLFWGRAWELGYLPATGIGGN